MHPHSRFIMLAALALGAVFTVGPQPAIAQTKDPILGSWKLDVSKSKFAGATPVRRSMMFKAAPNGITQSITTTTAGNAQITYHLEYTAKFDGMDYPADVASSFNTIMMKRVDSRTLQRIGKVQGTVVETETYTVSPDGQALSVKQEGENNGVLFMTAQVFERE
jgi:hypothetical protein